MKIRAIRVRDVGHFAAGAALEGLSGRLDVVVANNEIGKSTIFRALEAVFFEKHTGKGGRIQAITPRAGGSPLIEVDFDVGGASWRITKQFDRGRRAVLSELSGARRQLRGGDVDDALAQLIGLQDGLPGRLGFLWVGQGSALSPLAPDNKRGESSALHKFVEQQVADLTGGGRLRALRAMIAAELNVLATGARREPKAHGPWKRAISQRDDLKQKFAAAVAAQTQSRERREAMAANRLQRDALTAPDRVATANNNLAQAIAARDAALASRQLLRDAQARSHVLDAALDRAERNATILQGQIEEARSLEAAITAAEPGLAAAVAELATRRSAVEGLNARIAALMIQEQRAQHNVQAAQQRALAQEAQMQLAARLEALLAARALEADLATVASELSGTTVDEALLDRLIAADATAKRASDALAAGAPQVTIEYVPGVSGAITMDGTLLSGGPLDPSHATASGGRLRLEIPGVGVITVEAAATADRARNLALRVEAETTLAQGLAALDLQNLGEGLIRRQQSAALRARFNGLQAQMTALVPAGLAAFEAQIESTRAALDIPPLEADTLDQGAASVGLQQVRRDLAEERERLGSLQLQQEPLIEAIAREEATLSAHRARLCTLQPKLPEPTAWASVLAGLLENTQMARDAANAALRELAAVRQNVGDEAAVSALERRVSALEAEQKKDQQHLHTIALAMERLHGEEVIADAQEVAAQVPRIDGELQRAEADVQRHERDVAALALLDETLVASDAANLDRFLIPVVDNLNPYLALVFPGAHLTMAGDFSVNALKRPSGTSELNVMSGGTLEQIAVLVRLAFASLMADAGAAAPLILDDALVYTDDERLKLMFKALARGAERHQILFLTCHQNASDALGGQRVEFVPWSGETSS